jgi:Nitrile hydratase, alpha chain
LGEFGLHLPDDVEVRVYDSNAEIRYLVLPMRPRKTDNWKSSPLWLPATAWSAPLCLARRLDGVNLMDGMADMGGMHGFGPINRTARSRSL